MKHLTQVEQYNCNRHCPPSKVQSCTCDHETEPR